MDFQIFLVGDAQISVSTSSATGLKTEGGNSMLAESSGVFDDRSFNRSLIGTDVQAYSCY